MLVLVYSRSARKTVLLVEVCCDGQSSTQYQSRCIRMPPCLQPYSICFLIYTRLYQISTNINVQRGVVSCIFFPSFINNYFSTRLDCRRNKQEHRHNSSALHFTFRG